MAARTPTRLEGTVTTWNDDRGFGFISPDSSDSDVFVHVRGFRPGSAAPFVGQRVAYVLGQNAERKIRAEQVQTLTASEASGSRRVRPNPPKDSVSYLAIPIFLSLALVIAVLWQPPPWVLVLYVGASLVCFVGYWVDKAAAMAGRRRVPESALLIPGLLGGWPGAILGQQIFRHKTKKNAFRVTFWTSVVLNVTLLVLLTSPPGQALLTKTMDYWVGR